MGALSTLASAGMNAALSRSKAQASSNAIKAEAERDVASIRMQDAAQRQARERKLKQSVARQRALAAASGTGGSGGSSAAVRRGIKEQALDDDALAVRKRETAINNIRARASDKRRRNLLSAQSSVTKQAFGGALSIGKSLLGD